MIQLSPHVYCHRDTCNVYVIRNGEEAVLIDFGDGSVMDVLATVGVFRVTDVLMTHHHRDQGQGLVRAVEGGANIWVPHVEQDLFCNVDAHWQVREVENTYNVRQDRFSLLESVPIAGKLQDYQELNCLNHRFLIVPTPGHTIGSVSILSYIDGKHYAFTGDLIYAPGKVWSLSATQWTYIGGEGIAATILSLLDLQNRQPDLFLPSHGEPMTDPIAAADLLIERLQTLLNVRNQYQNLLELYKEPFTVVTPHLLYNRTAQAHSYVLLSDSGKALLIDYGYDFTTFMLTNSGFGGGADRAARRPWLYTISALKRQFNIDAIDVVVPTHYHDDHVAGLNLLQGVEGTKIWASENFAHILEHPTYYNLPCLWYDPIRVDRVLPVKETIQWEEYELILHPLPGHTLYAVAIQFLVDGKKVLAIGDQQDNDGFANYVYQNRFQIPDYQASSSLYQAIEPDLFLSGHWDPLWIASGHLDYLEQNGLRLKRSHADLLPLEDIDLGAEGTVAWMRPYRLQIQAGETFAVEVEALNPLPDKHTVIINMVVPNGWEVVHAGAPLELESGAKGIQHFRIQATSQLVRRARICVDVTVGNVRLGQHAEALVDIVESIG